MGTGDRRGGRTGDANGLLGRYGDGRSARRSERLGNGGSSRSMGRGQGRSSSRSGVDDGRYSDYADRAAARYAGSRSRGSHDDDDERFAPQDRSRASHYDDEPLGRRGADRRRYDDASDRSARSSNGRLSNGRLSNGSARYRGGQGWDRQDRGAEPPSKTSRRMVVVVTLAALLVALPPLLIFGVLPRLHLGSQVNTAFPWAGSSQQSAPIAGNDAFASQHDTVDPAFAAYYAAHAGTTTLGTPLTPGILTRSGIVQFYASGALLTAAPTPISSPSGTPASGTPASGTPAIGTPGATSTPKTTTATATPPSLGDTALQLVGDGPTLSGAAAGGSAPSGTPSTTAGANSNNGGNASAKIIELPVVAAMLKAGSQTPVASGATTSYLDLRSLASPDHLVGGSQPATLPTGTPQQPVFIATSGGAKGHNIPAALWAYITDPTISPAGWQTDIGAPLTEAQTLTVTQAGATHHLLIQAFWNAVLVADADTLSTAHPTIARGTIGADYLLTLGPPTLAMSASRSAWALANVAVLDAPVSGNATTHVGQNFPFALTGESTWDKATLWLGTSWSAGASHSGKGWVSGASLTFTPPDPSQAAQASFDALSPDLANYLSQQGQNMGVAVYDITRNTYYGYNDSQTFLLASTAKVYIMAAYLDWLEGQGRGPRADEVASLTRMIENSNNDDAQLLYDRVGYDGGMKHFLHKSGITDYVACPDGWGCADLSPADSAHLLTLLQEGKILNDSDRKLAFNLMGNIESDMRWGVGDTAPQGATFYMKDGWLNYPDPNLWHLNSVGIVTVGSETYVIGVYSQNNPSFDWSKVQHVCGAIAKALTS